MARGSVRSAGVVVVKLMMVGAMLLNGGSRVAASPAPIYRGADVKFTLGGSAKESTVVAESGGLRVTKRIGAEKVNIRIETARDVVDLEAIAGGKVRLSRRGKAVAMSLSGRDQKLIGQARRMTEGSPALTSFDAMIAALDGDDRAIAVSMRATWALLHVLRGDDHAAASLARRLTQNARNASASFIPARFLAAREETPIVCWNEYAQTVYGYYVEYAQCLLDYAWIPGGAQACSFEWIVKTELAWFWVVGCSGGVPV